MKNVLLISSRFPYPPLGGDKLKTYNLILILAKQYHIHFVAITSEKITDAGLDFCKKNFASYNIFYKHRFQHILSTVKTLWNGKPLQVNYYYFQDVQQYIDSRINHCDFTMNVLVRTAEYVLNYNKPKILDMVDSIGLNYQKSSNKVTSWYWRLLYKFEANRLLTYEKQCVIAYDHTLFVNKQECEHYQSYGKTVWIPNGVNENLFTYNEFDAKYNSSIVFFGKMDYQPNIDAIKWFMHNVWDKVHKEITLYIVGLNPTDDIKKLQSDRVVVTGFMSDPYIVLNSCLAIVAPMQTGGGIQNKILEAMALGGIVLTTSLGARPIVGAQHQQHFLVEDDGKKQAEILNDILANRERYQKIKKYAKNIVIQQYTWQHYETELIALLNDLNLDTKLYL